MLAGLERIPQGDVVLLHACCHNPTGFDLSHDDWRRVLDVVRRRELLPLIDFAYQGFGDGLEEDAWAVRLFAGELPEVLVTSSCSKNFGLYRDRVGALIVCAQNAEKLTDVRSQLAFLARNLWSTLPAHGAEVVAAILGDSELKGLWQEEVEGMRSRIASLRIGLVEALAPHGAGRALRPFRRATRDVFLYRTEPAAGRSAARRARRLPGLQRPGQRRRARRAPPRPPGASHRPGLRGLNPHGYPEPAVMAGFSPQRMPRTPPRRRITALRLFALPHHDRRRANTATGVIRRTSPNRANHKSALSKPYVCQKSINAQLWAPVHTAPHGPTFVLVSNAREKPSLSLVTLFLSLSVATAVSASPPPKAGLPLQQELASAARWLPTRTPARCSTRATPTWWCRSPSITKLMTAMVVLDSKLPLDEVLPIAISETSEMRGVFSRVRVGSQISRRDMLLLALMSRRTAPPPASRRTIRAARTPSSRR